MNLVSFKIVVLSMQIQTKKYHNFKINRICAAVFLKWTDFRTLFSAGETFSAWTFRHRDFSAPEHFGTWIFWPLSKQYGRFSTDILACSCRNFLATKRPHAKMSSCHKVSMMKCPCWNVSFKKVRYRNKPKPNIESNLMIFNNVEISCFNYTAWPLLHFE